MAEKLVPTAPTRITASDLYAAIRRIWPQIAPAVASSRQAIVLMLAHSALETGFWHWCWNYNLGNFKRVLGDGRNYYGIKHYEIEKGQRVWVDVDPSVPPVDPFISFGSLDEGVTYYLAALHGHWASAWPALLAGDVAGFCHELKMHGYYTAPEQEYEAGVFRDMHQLDAAIPPDTVPDLGAVAHAGMAQAQNELDETGHDAPASPESERT